MIERLFVYGTLAPGHPNAHVLADVPGTWEPASVTGHLREAGWGAALGFLGLDLDEAGEPIEGFVFSSAELAKHWARLDAFEGEAYQRILASTRLAKGEQVQAYLYALKPAADAS